MEICKATITLGDSKITFEGPAQFVEGQVKKFAATQAGTTTSPETAAVRERPMHGRTERELVTEKRPRGHHEIVAVLAFALSESGMKEFTEEDIRRSYIRADVRPPKHVSQALRDAKNNFDFIETGSKRGAYKLSNHGDRTVRFDLPRTGE
jgi:hypothetical protein